MRFQSLTNHVFSPRSKIRGIKIATQSNNSINTNALSPSCVERNFLPSDVFRSGLRALIHVEGSVRARLDDIPEIAHSISCSVMVVVRGTEVCTIVDGSNAVGKSLGGLAAGAKVKGEAEQGAGGISVSNDNPRRNFFKRGRRPCFREHAVNAR